MWWKKLIEAVVGWRANRQAVNRIPVPDLREMREEEARREVRILRMQEEQDRLESERRKRLDASGQG